MRNNYCEYAKYYFENTGKKRITISNIRKQTFDRYKCVWHAIKKKQILKKYIFHNLFMYLLFSINKIKMAVVDFVGTRMMVH